MFGLRAIVICDGCGYQEELVLGANPGLFLFDPVMTLPKSWQYQAGETFCSTCVQNQQHEAKRSQFKVVSDETDRSEQAE